MKDELITFDTAKLAKEKGFKFYTDSYYSSITGQIHTSSTSSFNLEHMLSRPTQSLLQKWLREIHKIFININSNENGHILTVGQFKEEYNIYEKALEEGLQEALKLIK